MKIDSIEEACQKTGYDQQQIEAAAAMMPEKLQKFIRSVALRAVICEAMNKGKVPDHSNYNQKKHEPIFNLDVQDGPSGFGLAFNHTYCWFTRTHVGARLQFLDSNDAKDFATNPNFMQLHSDALTYKK
jgi:hypothetical protein